MKNGRFYESVILCFTCRTTGYAVYFMSDFKMKKVETEQELNAVLDLCYSVLGEDDSELYGYDAWHERFLNGMQPLVCAIKDDRIVSAVLGRAENSENITIGFVACHEDYRRQGITKRLMSYFEDLARKQGYQYATLGSKEDIFYKKCEYKKIFEINRQSVYQKNYEFCSRTRSFSPFPEVERAVAGICRQD